jgi:hypothetical protein
LTVDAQGQPAIVGAIVASSVRQAMNIKGGHDLLTTFLEATKS